MAVNQSEKITGTFVAANKYNFLYGAADKPSVAFLKEGVPAIGFPAGIQLIAQQATLCPKLPAETIELIAKTYGMVSGANNETLINAVYQVRQFMQCTLRMSHFSELPAQRYFFL